MQRQSFVGPRGWAMFILLSGAALAAPFLRPPQVSTGSPALDATVSESPLSPNYATGQLASMRYEAATGVAIGRPTTAIDSKIGTGFQLPSALPAWATPASPLDALISQGAAPAWKSGAKAAPLKQLQPWLNKQLDGRGLPSTDPASFNGPPTSQHAIGTRASPWGSPSAPLPANADNGRASSQSLPQWPEALPHLLDHSRPAVLASERGPGSFAGATLVRPPVGSMNPTQPGGGGTAQPSPSAPPKFVFQPGYKP